jgi:Icc-related predicted phosphoesterase
MTRIVCVSDLHENLPEIPECDLLCIAGDLTFGFKGALTDQQAWLMRDFADWTWKVPAKEIAIVAGNHDQSVEQWGWPWEHTRDAEVLGSGFKPILGHYLEDSGARLCGLNVWGTPWQPWFYSWAFNAPENDYDESFLQHKFAQIPDDTDVVICHGPPRGYGDQVGNPHLEDRSGQPSVGSNAMTKRLLEIKPRLMVCGHIHSGYGRYRLWHDDGMESTVIVNAALVNNEYKPVNPVIVVDV